MKKLILLGAALLATSGAILIANNNGSTATEPCCDKAKCEQGVCKPTPDCPNPAECCKQ
jgi:hypothetical protein